MGTAHDRMADVAEVTKRLRADFPRETESFLAFLRETETDNHLDSKTKELMNVALSVAAQCEWCISFHTRNAGKLGATRAEIIEAGIQAVVMHGGPAFMYLKRLYDAADEYAADAGVS